MLQICCGQLWARTTSAHEAEKAVTGWLKDDAKPLGTTIGRRVTAVETFTDDTGEPVYYIVYLRPTGFAIVSADDLVEPIIAFADDGTYDPSDQNPLGALVNQDLKGRLAAVRADRSQQTRIKAFAVSGPQTRWNNLISLAETSENSITAFNLSSISEISDIRVAPLIQSKWSQFDVCNHNCFNYYTPNNYPCGCVATAMAQLMRYYQYPNTGIGVQGFTIKVNNKRQRAYTLGGDGYGGAYNWSEMELEPDCTTTDIQLQAIGALCYDASVSVNSEYSPNGSGADALSPKDALTTTFKYTSTIKGFNEGNNIGPGLTEMINPNLDYSNPVILGIWRKQGGHAVICDGYSHKASTLYHHLNMGWAGNYDAWYNLPNVEANAVYTSVISCIYNIFAQSTGEIISGLVTDTSGNPISKARVTAQSDNLQYEALTNDVGIYALGKVPSETMYIVSITKSGYFFTDQMVTTGTSIDGLKVSGNKWQIDFVGTVAGDFDGDNDVDVSDFAVFSWSWLTKTRDTQWNPLCDINRPADGFINMLDLAVFANNWLASSK